MLTRVTCQDARPAKIVVPLKLHEQGYERLMAHPEEARHDPSAMTELHYAMRNHADHEAAQVKEVLTKDPTLVCKTEPRDPLYYLFKYLEDGSIDAGNQTRKIVQVA